MKVCAEPSCPVLTRESRCPTHARPNAHQRGYNGAHKALRATYQRRMDKGEPFTCWRRGPRCEVTINPRAWDLGHLDDPTTHAGPECLPCNRSTASRRA